MSAPSAAQRFSTAVDEGLLDLPQPACGRTRQRFEALSKLGTIDLSFARLCEGHVDAVSILTECGRRPAAGERYGVWAASPPDLKAEADGLGWRLHGEKPFCSGATTLTRVLVTAAAPDGDRLFELGAADPGLRRVDGSWPAVGMAGSDSLTVAFDGVNVTPGDAVGGPGAYVGRPGFWWGAAGVAACWYGGAARLIDDVARALAAGHPDQLPLADLGVAVATAEAMRVMLGWAAERIDADPHDQAHAARTVAMTVRQVVHAGCLSVLERTAAAGGARPLTHDGSHSRAASDLFVYLSQHHGGRDAVELGRATLSGLA